MCVNSSHRQIHRFFNVYQNNFLCQILSLPDQMNKSKDFNTLVLLDQLNNLFPLERRCSWRTLLTKPTLLISFLCYYATSFLNSVKTSYILFFFFNVVHIGNISVIPWDWFTSLIEPAACFGFSLSRLYLTSSLSQSSISTVSFELYT